MNSKTRTGYAALALAVMMVDGGIPTGRAVDASLAWKARKDKQIGKGERLRAQVGSTRKRAA